MHVLVFASVGDEDVLQKLIELNMNVNIPDRARRTPLHYAAFGSVNMAQRRKVLCSHSLHAYTHTHTLSLFLSFLPWFAFTPSVCVCMRVFSVGLRRHHSCCGAAVASATWLTARAARRSFWQRCRGGITSFASCSPMKQRDSSVSRRATHAHPLSCLPPLCPSLCLCLYFQRSMPRFWNASWCSWCSYLIFGCISFGSPDETLADTAGYSLLHVAVLSGCITT